MNLSGLNKKPNVQRRLSKESENQAHDASNNANDNLIKGNENRAHNAGGNSNVGPRIDNNDLNIGNDDLGIGNDGTQNEKF